jgi:poly-beta-hydroxyalkanoate depolymerase
MTDKLAKELKRRRPEAKKQKFPKVKKAFKDIVRKLAKRYSRPAWLIENTIREKGLSYTLQVLSQSPPPKKESVLDKLKRLWSRRRWSL